MYYNEAISQSKNNLKELWKFIKSVLPNKRTSTTPPPTIMKDRMLFEDPNDILEQFNNYFQEIGQSIANSACHSANSTLKLICQIPCYLQYS